MNHTKLNQRPLITDGRNSSKWTGHYVGQGLLELLWTVYSEGKLQSCLKPLKTKEISKLF